LIAKNAITLQRRTVATIQTAWNSRSSVLVANLQHFTAKLVNSPSAIASASTSHGVKVLGMAKALVEQGN
jgi:uncharacterized protein (DUF1697 family)